MAEIVLVQAPPSVPFKLLTTNVAHQVWIVFDSLVPANVEFQLPITATGSLWNT